MQAVTKQAGGPPSGAPSLAHDPGVRLRFRDFAARIAAADAALARDGMAPGGANIVELARFQAALAPDEAALAIAPAAGGLAYMCVRRDATLQAVRRVDALQLKLDTRLMQAALSATYAPSEALDVQFPAAAAVRLYDVLVRPFEPCLKDGDRILWLPGVAGLSGVPLAALLPASPPKLGQGYDLAGADWLVRHHAVSYPGSAAMVLAARSGGRRSAPAFDFLGVGDPALAAAGGELAALAPLPETKDELEASAAGFANSRILTGRAATERAFRGELVGGYRYLSFATHGLLRDDLQGLSEPALVLTPVSAGDPADDGLLTANEIADLNLKAAFVALSACNTANYDLGAAARDLPALASAFAVAGAPATLATLWPVNSQAGKQVVAGAFAGLRATAAAGPAQALADAQRAFLAAPPGRAWLHPRFWAPFVVLGDGDAAPRAAASSLTVTSVEPLTEGRGEGLSVRRVGDRVVARFIGGPDAAGRRTAGLRLSGGADGWRTEAEALGAGAFAVRLGGRVAAAGAGLDAEGRLAPRLDLFDAASGKPAGTWTAPSSGAELATVLNGADLGGGRALLVTGDLRPRDGEAPRLRVFEMGPDTDPRLLFEARAPAGHRVDAATVTAAKDDLILTFTDRHARPQRPAPDPSDDYDMPLCPAEAVTWIERRDARTGALKAAREVRGLDVTAGLARSKGVLLAGAAAPACGDERRAVVAALDRDLATRTLYRDESLGESWAWSLSAMPAGRVFVAATKRAVVDVRPVATGHAAAIAAAVAALPTGTSGMALVLDATGRASAPRMLESGADVFVNGADASRPDDILLAGALGGRAVIFHLAAGR